LKNSTVFLSTPLKLYLSASFAINPDKKLGRNSVLIRLRFIHLVNFTTFETIQKTGETATFHEIGNNNLSIQ